MENETKASFGRNCATVASAYHGKAQQCAAIASRVELREPVAAAHLRGIAARYETIAKEYATA